MSKSVAWQPSDVSKSVTRQPNLKKQDHEIRQIYFILPSMSYRDKTCNNCVIQWIYESDFLSNIIYSRTCTTSYPFLYTPWIRLFKHSLHLFDIHFNRAWHVQTVSSRFVNGYPANIKTDGGYTASFYDKLRWSWAELRSPGSMSVLVV